MKRTLLSDWLSELEVPFTPDYADSLCNSMPFQTLFGLEKALGKYGIRCRGVKAAGEDGLRSLPLPFAAGTKDGAVVVAEVSPDSVTYLSCGKRFATPLADFLKAWNGMAMIACADDNSTEPGYRFNRIISIASIAKKYVFWIAVLLLLVYFTVTRRIYASWSLAALTVIDLAGLFISTLLVRHQLGYEDKAAHSVCSVLQEGGCNAVLATSASKFFGLFGWSEVGFAYFSVTLATMLLFPEHMGSLALINLCCLPFTLWSLWYQKFRAKAWCTMCVSVQAMLWMQFGCYLGGGWYRMILPVSPWIIVLGAAYVAALLGLNALTPVLKRNNEEDS